jgi:hypothetical protein
MTDPHEVPPAVAAWLAALEPTRQADVRRLIELMRAATGDEPKMWGSMVGFGSYHYRYDSGREGDAMRIGFAVRKAELTVYLMDGFEGRADLLERLGRHRIGKACLYLKKLEGLDHRALAELIDVSVAGMAAKYPIS